MTYGTSQITGQSSSLTEGVPARAFGRGGWHAPVRRILSFCLYREPNA